MSTLTPWAQHESIRQAQVAKRVAKREAQRHAVEMCVDWEHRPLLRRRLPGAKSA